MDFREKGNLMKLTIMSYGMTCITGIAVILPFIIQQPAQDYFKSSAAYTGFVFSFFMFGMLIFQILNGFIVKVLKIRAQIYLTAVVYLICSLAMFMIHSIVMLIPILIILGLCFGLIITIPNFILVHAFEGKERSTKLNRGDFMFSIGSLAYPMIASFMLSRHFSWQAVYLSVVILIIIVVILCAKSVIPNVDATETAGVAKFSKWNMNVYMVGFAIFFYFLSYVGYTYWVAEYLTTNLKMSPTAADFGISLFWIMYAVGCFISSYAVKYIAVNKYIIISAIVSFIAYFVIYYSTGVMMMYVSISILGIGCATIYSSAISYGTLLVEHPSPRIISFFIASSGIGTYLAEVYSSWVQAQYGLSAVTVVSALMMLVTIVLMIVVAFTDKQAVKSI
ncbi:MAG: MFS transporter [Lentisphaerota bacterium]